MLLFWVIVLKLSKKYMLICKLLYYTQIFLLRLAQNWKNCTFFRQLKDYNSGREHENYTNNPIFFHLVFLFCLHLFLNLKKKSCFQINYWSILVHKIPQFFAKSYWFRQFIILFWKADTLMFLKIYIIFYLPAGAKCPLF